MLDKIIKAIINLLSSAAVMAIVKDLIAGKSLKDSVSVEKSIELAVDILNSEAVADLAAQSPEKVLKAIVIASPLLDRLQAIALEAQKEAGSQAVS